jgi:hypothetical protein
MSGRLSLALKDGYLAGKVNLTALEGAKPHWMIHQPEHAHNL